MEWDQRCQPFDLVFAERAQHSRRGVLAVNVPDDQLRDHWVVHRRDLAVLTDAGVNAHAGPGRLYVAADFAGGGGKVLGSVLGVDAALDRVAAHLNLILRN